MSLSHYSRERKGERRREGEDVWEVGGGEGVGDEGDRK